MDNPGFYDEHGNYIEKGEKAGNGHANGDSAPPPYSNGKKAPEEWDMDGDGKKIMIEMNVEEEDPWKVTSIDTNYTPWSELTGNQKILRAIGYIVKPILVIICLYFFICSLDFLSSAFRLLGGEAAGKVFQQSDIMTNPIAGLMMGVLVTVLVQSSSTSTSIVVSMVGAGILDIDTAIPIIMGANIGTSVTNTIVSIGQISDKGEFRRAFAGATVHDMFNWLSVIVLLPLELITGYLKTLTGAIVDSLPGLETNKGANKDILKVVTQPFTKLIIEINKNAITDIATGKDKNEYDESHAIMKTCCDKTTPIDCCKDEISSDDTFGFINYGINYTTNQKNNVCKVMTDSCYDSDQIPASCLTLPWQYGKQTHEETVYKIDCSAFKGQTAEVSCCNTRIGAAGFTKNETQGCLNISDCFTSSSHKFTQATCLSSWKNMTEEKTSYGDTFSCKIWTKSVMNKTCYKECEFLFKGMYPALDDKAIGAILLVISLAILCICLICIVKLLHSLLRGPMAILIKKFINADFPGPCAYFTGYLAILVGAGLTIVVQSSSIFTSTLTPLVGIGVIELDRMYPLTLGSNIGTTTTAILSALASSSSKLKLALQVAFCHLFFNISGIILFYPIPYLRFPIPMAKFLGNRTANYRWFAIAYLLLMFFLFPFIVFALSIPGWYVLLAVLGPIAILIIIVGIIKVIQEKKPKVLPAKLQDWKFLPKPLRSLEPYDNIMQKIFFCKKFRNPDKAPVPPKETQATHTPTSSPASYTANTRL